MKLHYLLIFSAVLLFASCGEEEESNTRTFPENFEDYVPAPKGKTLWTEYSPEATSFRIWSPTADEIKILLYEKGNGGEAYDSVDMKFDGVNLWEAKIKGDLKGKYYTFKTKFKGKYLPESPGMYAMATGVNGKRAMIIDLAETNPAGWADDKGPEIETPNDLVIYELHVRDMSSHPNSGSSHPGKYLGLVETGTKSPDGLATGIDHLKELGITHVHLLPAFDHYSIDETKLDEPQFNWGYDPKNYNVPEGSYSSDPYKAEVRIKEFKQMVKAFHDNGIGVILDVVYNHTGRTDDAPINLETPGYFYRFNPDSTFSNASGCGNETASEREMMRRYMVESVKFWAEEYHLDGFRFDLMGIHDIETMEQLTAAAKEVNRDIFVYGEGWTAGDSPLPEDKRAIKKHTYRMKDVIAFSDDIRDGLKGSVFEDESTGFVSGAENMEETVKFGVVGSIYHKQIDYKAVNYSDTAWTNEPWQAVSYVSCHDNHTLYDKLKISAKDASEADIKKMHKLANAIVLTSQGIPFIHAGAEMLRTKDGEHNSYNLPDSVNQIDWAWKSANKDVFDYYRDLIHLRKAHPAFSMPNAVSVRENLEFFETQAGLVGYKINGKAVGDSWSEIIVWYNANPEKKKVKLEGKWEIAVLGDEINPEGVESKRFNVKIPPISMMIAFKK